MSAEEYQRAINFKAITGEKPEAAVGRALKFGEWIGLFAMCAADDSPAGVRDAAVIALFKIAGLHRAEMAALSLDDNLPLISIALSLLYNPVERRDNCARNFLQSFGPLR